MPLGKIESHSSFSVSAHLISHYCLLFLKEGYTSSHMLVNDLYSFCQLLMHSMCLI